MTIQIHPFTLIAIASIAWTIGFVACAVLGANRRGDRIRFTTTTTHGENHE